MIFGAIKNFFANYFWPAGVFFIIYIGKESRYPVSPSGKCSEACKKSEQSEPLSKKARFSSWFHVGRYTIIAVEKERTWERHADPDRRG